MNTITLYTPCTGFPDLEAKIAYGLARVGIEASMKGQILCREKFYEISFSSEKNNLEELLDKSFRFLLKRFISNPEFYNLGVKAKDKKKYIPVDRPLPPKLSEIYSNNIFTRRYHFTKNKSCFHDKSLKFGAIKSTNQPGGLILLGSVHAGKPKYRDNRWRDLNLGLCEICGHLNVLGKESFCFTIQMGNRHRKASKYIWITPILKNTISFKNLITLLSLQKKLHNFWLSDVVPLRTIAVGLFAKIPSLAETLAEMMKQGSDFNLHLTVLSRDSHGDTIVENTAMIETFPFVNFISYSPYNVATVMNLIDQDPPKVRSLVELTNFIERPSRDILMKFARIYVQETSKEKSNFSNLVFSKSTEYMLDRLKEVKMIKDEVIKSEAVKSLAKTLGYFVWKKEYLNYSFADGLRNARNPDEVGKILEKLYREAKLRYDQEKEKEKEGKEADPPHIPHPDDLDKVNELLQKGTDFFPQVKTTLYLLAFSWESHKTIKLKKEEHNA